MSYEIRSALKGVEKEQVLDLIDKYAKQTGIKPPEHYKNLEKEALLDLKDYQSLLVKKLEPQFQYDNNLNFEEINVLKANEIEATLKQLGYKLYICDKACNWSEKEFQIKDSSDKKLNFFKSLDGVNDWLKDRR